MKRLSLVSLAMLASTLTSAPAFAIPDEMPMQVAIDTKLIEQLPVNQLGVDWFFQDVHAITPNSGGSIGTVDGAVIGAGATVEHRLNQTSNWFLHAGGGYGVGSDKIDVGGLFPFTDKTTFKAYYGSVGAGYVQPLTSHTSIYTKGGFYFSGTKGTFDDGTTKVDGETFKVYGIDKSFGGRLQMNPTASLYGELYSVFGWGSGEDGDAKITRTVKYGCFRGGVSFGF